MRTREDIEAYLSRSGHPHAELDEQTWLVSDPSGVGDKIVVRLAEDIIVFRMKVLELSAIDETRREELFHRLLRLNVEDMVHGSYGVVGKDIVISASLRLENLDFSEFSGTLEDFSLAVTNHYSMLRDYLAPVG
jgi:hypothetical protein